MRSMVGILSGGGISAPAICDGRSRIAARFNHTHIETRIKASRGGQPGRSFANPKPAAYFTPLTDNL